MRIRQVPHSPFSQLKGTPNFLVASLIFVPAGTSCCFLSKIMVGMGFIKFKMNNE